MNRSNNVKVTTTSGFDGIKIKDYLEPVTANVVVGMNVFKDMFAGLTDFFGGKSRSYQNVLSSINAEVINKLKDKAISIGGNCILSLKIDNDEISAQGKSMMMVSAVGTAAIAEFNSNHNYSLSDFSTKSKRLNYEKFSILKQKEEYLKNLKVGELDINEEFWTFVKRYAVIEFATYILEKYISTSSLIGEYTSEEIQKFTNNTKEYFSLIDNQIAIETVYSKLSDGDISAFIKSKLINMIKENKLIDYSRIINLLSNDNFELRKIGLELSILDKEFYIKSDISSIEIITNMIPSSFYERGTKTTKKRTLSSKLKEIWICECGAENSISNQYCSKCENDYYGFTKDEQKPNEILNELLEINSILKENIKE